MGRMSLKSSDNGTGAFKVDYGAYAAAALSCLILSTACGKPAPQWQAAVEEVDGVAVVKNPSEPLNPDLQIKFEEDLTIGVEEGDENYMFGGSILLNTDDEGKFYVTDVEINKVKVYDANGRFLQTIGGPGQGPGEFQDISKAGFDADGNIYLNDVKSQRISLLSKDGRYLRGIRPPTLFERVLITSQGSYVARAVDNVELGQGKKWDYFYGLFDADFNLVAEFLRLPREANANKSTGSLSQALADAMSETAFVPVVNYALDKNDLLYFGNPETYEIKVYSARDGRLVRVIQRDFEPSGIGRGDKEYFERSQREQFRNKMPAGLEREIFALVRYPEYKPAYESFTLMENGWILVLADSMGDESTVVDIFNERGVYLARFETGIATDGLAFNNGYAYAVAAIDDFMFIKRYDFEIMGMR